MRAFDLELELDAALAPATAFAIARHELGEAAETPVRAVPVAGPSHGRGVHGRIGIRAVCPRGWRIAGARLSCLDSGADVCGDGTSARVTGSGSRPVPGRWQRRSGAGTVWRHPVRPPRQSGESRVRGCRHAPYGGPGTHALQPNGGFNIYSGYTNVCKHLFPPAGGPYRPGGGGPRA